MFITMIHPTSSAQSATGTFDSDDSKYAVADILTSFHSTGDNSSTPLNLSTSYTPVTTTDILTPTTLANLEQTFLELQQSVAPTPHTVSLPRESGFVPPIVDPIRPSSSTAPQMVKQEYDYSIYQDDSSQDLEDEWMPPSGKQARYDDSSAMMESYVEENVSMPGRRRRKHDDSLNPEESSRRNVRRERNKVAAAKCRQRRVDLTNTLINESEGLEEEQSKLENEIQMLNQQKEQLEFLLEAHKPVCAADVLGNSSTPKTSSSMSVKAEKVDITYPSVFNTATVGTSTSQSPFPMPSSAGKFSSQTSHRLMSRPNTLPIPYPKVSCRVTEATGVPITTPSSVFNIGLESMLDGHTGLTPITGAPSCASQLHRASTDGSSSPSENLSSPTTLMAL